MTLKLRHKEWLVFIILILLLADLVIFLNIPFLRQIFGFLFLTILPGLLILRILKLNKIDFLERFILTWGLSVSFLMFYGLLINNSSLSLGYETPLSTILLVISFNFAAIALTLGAHQMNKNAVFSLPDFNLSTSEKAFLIVPVLFPTLSIFGMHMMNTTDNNIILMLLLFLIPIYVVLVCLFNQKFPKRLYPVVIFFISISLLLLLPLRSNHIVGMDSHSEYYFFRTTLDNLHWSVFGHSVLDACLSISLLPTIYQSILNISPEFLFKILYSLIYSVSPLVIYVISKKYVEEGYAFLASCFFMFQFNFLFTELNARTNTAILFFALAMMTLFSDRIEPLKKRILFIVFTASCVVSHYSTTYLFFFILLGAFVGIEILSKKYTFKKIIRLTSVILFFSMIFLWYSQVTETAFNAGVGFVKETLTNLNKFFVAESRSPTCKNLFGQELKYGILSRANLALTWGTFILIGVGILTMVKRYKEMVYIPTIKLKNPDFLKTKFEVEYFVIALLCAGLLVMMVTLPFVSTGYNFDRLYAAAITILSVFFVIGGITLSKHFFFFTKRKPVLKGKQKSLIKNFSFIKKASLKKQKEGGKGEIWRGKEDASQIRAYLIILLILIPYSMFVTGVMHQTFGAPVSIILSSEGEQYDLYYVHDQESCGAKWLANNAEQKNIRIYTDWCGERRLISQAGFSPHTINRQTLTDERNIEIKGYVYLRYYNVVNKKLLDVQFEEHNITEYSDTFARKSKLYNNGGAEIWK